jgi:hypothetical protein
MFHERLLRIKRDLAVKMTMQFKVLLTILVTVYCYALSGCLTMKIGRLPDTSLLESDLKPQISTREDVRRLLGEPKGAGGIFFPIDKHPKDCWYYYYEEGTFKEDQRIFLFIIFYQDLYDGYMWFSSLPGTTSFTAE